MISSPNTSASTFQRIADDDGKRDQPHGQIDFGGIAPFWPIGGFVIGCPVFPRKPVDQDKDRNDDDQHERERRNDEEALGVADGPFGLEQGQMAAAAEKSCSA